MADRLYRSRHDRMLFGVAGGMARYFRLDPALVRLVWVLLFLAVGAGVLLYIAAAVVIPEEPAGAGAAGRGAQPGWPGPPSGTEPSGGSWPSNLEGGSGAVVLGLILIVVGGWFLLDRFIDIDARLLWPAALLAIGLVLVLGSLRGRGRRS